MKIGILTFHRAKNYGAMLQCYALSSFLKSMGFEVGVLDYRPDYLAGAGDTGIAWKIKKYIRFFIYWMLSKCEVRQADGFESFVSRHLTIWPLSDSVTLDAIVCGSDQIWSTNICGKLDPVFFGEVAVKPSCKRISYAASNGNVALEAGEEKDFLGLLSGFDAISVREKSLKDYLKSKQVDARWVLDPVLLAGRQMFEPIVSPVRQKRPYVLVYELTHLDATYELAHKIARSLRAEVLVMGGGMGAFSLNGVKNKQGLSPAQFVSYFKYASCVVTTSFHGTAFSILYEKPFYSMRMNSAKDDRILSLLSELQLMDRSVARADEVQFSWVNYELVNKKLETLRQDSRDFLINALKEV